MKLRLMFFAALIAAALSVSLAASSAIGASVVYNAIPSPLPPNVASVGYEATSTSEFGDYVHLAGTNRHLDTVTVTMSDWALYSDYSSDPQYSGNLLTWSHPITVNVYSSSLALLATKTQNVTIPWRPVADAACGTAWKASNGNCYNGLAFNATFDLSSLNQALPSDVIVGVAYNTADYGPTPLGVAGPYNSLNVGVPTGQTASVGTDNGTDNVFWNTSYAPFYADDGAAGIGTFRQDTGWAPNGTAAFQITASPICTPTGFKRDGIDLTAAQIGGNVTGDLDATGCNIGVYYGPSTSAPPTVVGANIHGANYYGVVVNAAAVNVTNTLIHDIGESPFSGSQHGVGVLYTTLNPDGVAGTKGTAASGTLSGGTISRYQKNGVVISGAGAAVTVKNVTVNGLGQIDYIAQNGIQISYGASGTVTGNTVSNNYYTPTSYTACGLLFYQAAGVKQSSNTFSGNEINICNAGRGGGNPRP
jgi:Right handed beta helix region